MWQLARITLCRCGDSDESVESKLGGLPRVPTAYFQIYNTDTKELLPENTIDNITIPGSGGNPDQGVAVARAKIADVVAKQHTVVPFKKYFQGHWSEPALATGYNQSGGNFTPLDLPVQHFIHGDAAYIPSIKHWALVTPSGGSSRTEKTR